MGRIPSELVRSVEQKLIAKGVSDMRGRGLMLVAGMKMGQKQAAKAGERNSSGRC